MTHQHLSEEVLQALALNAEEAVDPGWRTCPHCAERVEGYRSLYSSVAAMEPEQAGFDLEAAVWARLPERVGVKPSSPKPMFATPILIGSLAFLAVVIFAGGVIWGPLAGQADWITGMVLVTVPGIALWMLVDAVLDHRRKLRSLGLS